MVRITTERDGSSWVVRVHGDLRDRDVPALQEACRRGGARRLCLDLSELRGLDDCGVEAIRAVVADGAQVSGASPYIDLRLDQGRNKEKGRKT